MKSVMEEGATAASTETASESPQASVQKKQQQASPNHSNSNGAVEKNGNDGEATNVKDNGSGNGNGVSDSDGINGTLTPAEGEEGSSGGSNGQDSDSSTNENRNGDDSTQDDEKQSSKDKTGSSKASSSGSKSKHDKASTSSTNGSQPQTGPNKEATDALLAKTGYSLEITSGQRKYGGPPPESEVQDGPGAGHEVFIGKLPKDVYEVDLVPVLEEFGRIWDLRIMIDPVSGLNRGYAFVTFCEKEDASKAVTKLDGYQIRKGKILKANISVPNVRLFVGNIPKSKSRQEIMDEFAKITEELKDVIIYTSPEDRKKNRGFCFIEYDSHKAASQAKRKLSSGRIRVWNCDILVDWADPQEEPDEETMSKVKVLYVRNLTSESTEESLRTLFEPHGQVERVKKIKDYAFVHFLSRESAVRAMEQLDGTPVNGVKMEVSLAKPPSDKRKKEEMLRNRERRVMIMMQNRSMNSVVPSRLTPLLPAPPHHSHLMPWLHASHAAGWGMGPGPSTHPPGALSHWLSPAIATTSHPHHQQAAWNAILASPAAAAHHLAPPPLHDLHNTRPLHSRSGIGSINKNLGSGDGNQSKRTNGKSRSGATNGSGGSHNSGNRNGNSKAQDGYGNHNNHGSNWQPYHY